MRRKEMPISSSRPGRKVGSGCVHRDDGQLLIALETKTVPAISGRDNLKTMALVDAGVSQRCGASGR
jgi:hypothetical protein